MSIRDLISTRVGNGELYRVVPLMKDRSGLAPREMYVSSGIWSGLNGPWEDVSFEHRFNRLRADLERFVQGGLATVSLTPGKAKNAYMGRLDKPTDEVWDIRSQDPSPGLRVFGRFADRDLFIAFNWAPRSRDWAGRKRLGTMDSREFKEEISTCKREWHRLLHPYKALEGDGLSDYISANYTLV